MYSTLISVDELCSNLGKPNWVLLDCRFSLADTSQGEQAFSQSRISGAQYAHLDRHLSGEIVADKTGRHPLPDTNTLANQFKLWGINADTQIVAYDDSHGAMASRLWWLSRYLGHEPCAVLNGGFAAWKNAALPVDTTALATKRAPGNFHPTPSLVEIVLKADVLNPANCLLDAREAERYKGEKEPIDAVAGRIPGALNAPFILNLNSDHTFKSCEELQQRFTPAMDAAKGKKLVHYCGSGVTAAHNMLAMAHSGLDTGAMYAGSFSEWIADKNFETYPIQTDGQSIT